MFTELEIFKKELQPYTDRAYFVGGCVRDEFLNRACKDIDIEVFDVEQKTLENILNICAEKLGSLLASSTASTSLVSLIYLFLE